MKIHEEHITEDHKLEMREREISPNEWIDVVPYAIEMDVFIQDYDDDKVEFGWVGSYRLLPDLPSASPGGAGRTAQSRI